MYASGVGGAIEMHHTAETRPDVVARGVRSDLAKKSASGTGQSHTIRAAPRKANTSESARVWGGHLVHAAAQSHRSRRRPVLPCDVLGDQREV